MGLRLLTFIIVLISPPHAFNQLMVQQTAHGESDGMAKDLK